MIRIRQVQGIDDPDEYVVFKSTNFATNLEGFAVKNWNFPTSGTSPNSAYPYLNICPLGNGSLNANAAAVFGQNSYNWASYTEVTDANGIEGQGGTLNPASLFQNHQVMISGEYYDPSYGIKHASIADVDANSIAGFYIIAALDLNEATYNLDLNSDGDKIDAAVPNECFLFRTNATAPELIETKQNR